jgi:hypothetical protein
MSDILRHRALPGTAILLTRHRPRLPYGREADVVLILGFQRGGLI